jgi:hypothetical protein
MSRTDFRATGRQIRKPAFQNRHRGPLEAILGGMADIVRRGMIRRAGGRRAWRGGMVGDERLELPTSSV